MALAERISMLLHSRYESRIINFIVEFTMELCENAWQQQHKKREKQNWKTCSNSIRCQKLCDNSTTSEKQNKGESGTQLKTHFLCRHLFLLSSLLASPVTNEMNL